MVTKKKSTTAKKVAPKKTVKTSKKAAEKISKAPKKTVEKVLKTKKIIAPKKEVVKEVAKRTEKNSDTPAKTGADVFVTKEGFEKLQTELKDLKTHGRREIAERLSDAISYGDLSENSEYDEAKNQQAFLEMRIVELEDRIKNAKIIKETAAQKGTISIGSSVKLRFEGQEVEYTIVGSTESDPMVHKISNESPVGSAILGKKVKDMVEIEAPGGIFKYEILSVR